MLTKQYYFFDFTLHNNPDKSVTMIFSLKNLLPRFYLTKLLLHSDFTLTILRLRFYTDKLVTPILP